MKRLTKSLLFIVNIVVAVLFAIAALAKYISPEIFSFPSFVALGFPYLFIANIFFVIVWFLRLKAKLFLSLIVLFAGWGQFQSMLQINFDGQVDEGKQLNIVTHNIRAFGLNGPKFETTTGTKIFKYYRSTDADIYCFQEFLKSNNNKFSAYDSLKKAIKTKYEHIEFAVHFRGNNFGLATFSKYPIVNKGIVEMPQQGTNLCIFTDININKQTVRVYNFHLASIHFNQREYEYIENIETKNQDEHIVEAKNLYQLLKNAFKKRAQQAEIIKTHIAQSPYPVIVCGDLNDTPNAYAYHVLKKNLNDSFEKKGMYLGHTYNGKLPPLRIDFVFASPQFTIHNHEVDYVDLSDHFPVRVLMQ